MSYVQTYYHIIFSTKYRQPVLLPENRKYLYKYICGILKNKKCHLYRLNGIEDHIHMFISLHQLINLADLIREIKTSCTFWIKKNRLFPDFEGWQEEYSAFTKSHRDKDAVINYIKNQIEHHKNHSSIDELRILLMKEGIEFNEQYLK